MKKASSFIFTRWWNSLGVQNRLFVAFTVLVVYCLLALGGYLYLATRLVTINQDATFVFEQNRTIYQLDSLVQQYLLAFNQYEISSSSEALDELHAISGRIDETVVTLASDFYDEDSQDLAEFAQYKAEIDQKVEQIVTAVDREDWDSVVETDKELDQPIDSMIAAVNGITERGWERVEAVNAEKDGFETALQVILWAGLPLFLALAGLVTLIVHAQINHPLEQLAQAAEAVLDGHFDPGPVESLARREDEVGIMARQFLKMTGQVEQRAVELEREAAEIKAKIR